MITKKELVDLLEKYDDESEISFFDKDSDNELRLDSVDEYVETMELTLRLSQIV